MSQIQPSKGIALLLSTFFGTLGADKFYLGKTGLGILQILLSFSLIGLIINGPYIFLCSLSLIIAILLGGNAFMYSDVDWAPTNQYDKIMMWISIGFMIAAFIVTMISRRKSKDNYQSPCPYCGGYNCNCPMRRGGCSACSRGMIGPYT